VLSAKKDDLNDAWSVREVRDAWAEDRREKNDVPVTVETLNPDANPEENPPLVLPTVVLADR
jgi:hypothetical protein